VVGQSLKAKGGPFIRDPPMAESEKTVRVDRNVRIGQQRILQKYSHFLSQNIPLWWHFLRAFGEKWQQYLIS
jgi:hypothetical protein